MTEIKKKQFIYGNSVTWQGEKKGVLSSSDKPDVQIATPPEFKGHPGFWSPEDLFVAAINSCIMTTFLYYAQKNNLKLSDYRSDAQGIIEMQDFKLIFTEVRVNPEVVVSLEEDLDKAKELINKAEAACLISNSIKSKVLVKADIICRKY